MGIDSISGLEQKMYLSKVQYLKLWMVTADEIYTI